MSCFNRALLAKQAWRLLNNGDTLLNQCLKAKYYPRVSPIDAVTAYNPSYSWRSISAGFEVIHLGVLWRVGNGALIRVGRDKWVPSAPYFHVDRELDFSNANRVVADFITSHGAWDEEALRELFSPSEVDNILTIPLAINKGGDTLRWHYTQTGIYTVKSGYHVLRKYQELGENHPSTSTTSSR